ncbi:hypothetical protein B0H16DRAFT_1001908 [Mycena metata]|uniref:Uncharacterized protein n=1 Tax=Mycena metata TaxID=1033252 RepID=A0AAD7K149_9AGAR|nr:hypothetical protein B0H16DRAFT_1001908 [Mycena metata]
MQRILLGFRHSSSTTYSESAKSSFRHVLFIFPSAGCHYYCILGGLIPVVLAQITQLRRYLAPLTGDGKSEAEDASSPIVPLCICRPQRAHRTMHRRRRNPLWTAARCTAAEALAQGADEMASRRRSNALHPLDFPFPFPHFRSHAATASALHHRARPFCLEFVEGPSTPRPAPLHLPPRALPPIRPFGIVHL